MIPPRVSVVMATYNGASFVREQLHSFVDQTRQPDELIVSDDASQDDTLGIVEAFAVSAPFPVTIFRAAANRGFSGNFEQALPRATGDLIFISDQDDVWLPEKIATVMSAFDGPGVQVVTHNLINTRPDLSHEGVTLLDNILALGLSKADLIMGCATAFRRSWLDCALPIPDGLIYDSWFNHLSEKVGVRRVIAEPLAYYRRHPGTVFQWVASEPMRVGKRDRPRPASRPDARSRWTAEAQSIAPFIERLERGQASWRAFGVETAVAKSLEGFRRRKSALEARTVVRNQPRLRRLPGIARMLRSGQYRYFNGLRGALKDLFR